MRNLAQKPLFLLAAVLACAGALRAETRFFVSSAGSLLEAEIVSVAGETVVLKKKDDGREIPVPKATLCKADHAYIDAWVAAHPEQVKSTAAAPVSAAPPTAAGAKKFGFTTMVRSKKSTNGFADGGYKAIDLSYGYSIQSREVTREISGAKLVVLTFAKEAGTGDGDQLYVMQRVEQELNLKPQGKLENATPEVRLQYYQGTNYRNGAKEYGYMLIITDSAGVIQHTDCNPPTLEKFIKEALDLKPPCVVSREFRLMNTSFPTGDIELDR